MFANVPSGGTSNPGPGLGGLAIDTASRTLFVSDLDTGLIHALSLAADAGTERDVFDYGLKGRPVGKKPALADDGKRADITAPAFDATKPETWGFTPIERRIDALAVHDGRLYFAVAEGPQIWSIAISQGGKFDGEARFETAAQSQETFPVTSIAFDSQGHMLVAQRGTLEVPQDYSRFVKSGASQVLRFSAETPDDPATAALWKPAPQEYAVSHGKEHRFASGGLALQYAYGADGAAVMSTCRGSVVMSADSLGPQQSAHGLQLNGIDLVRPANVPPNESVFVNWDPRQNDAAVRGIAGGIAVLQICADDAAQPALAGAPGGESGAGLPGQDGGEAGVPGDAAQAGGQGTTEETIEDGGGGTTTDPTEEGGGGTTTPQGSLVVAKTASVDTCSPKGGCAFNIQVSNPTATDVPGPIVIDDQIDAPQAALTGEPNAPWTCSKAAPFACTHPGPVPANGTLDDLRLVFAPNTAAEVKQVTNCAAVQGGGAAAPGNPNNAALPPPPAATASNVGGLVVEKRGLAATCSPAAGTCEFEVKVTNATGQPINQQPLKIFDTMSVGSQTQAKNDLASQQLPAGLACTPEGREFNCSQDALTLAPGASLSFKAAFKIDTSEGGPAGFVTNKALVTLGPLTGEATASIAFDKPVNVELPEPVPGEQANANNGGAAQGGAAQSCATIALDPKAPVQTGPITTTKKGPATCTAKGPCAFTITVTNTTDAAIAGPIVINEQIDAPQAVLSGEPNAPWTCTKTAPVSTCTHPGPLAAKQSVDLNISFTPNTPPDVKELKNCAVPKQPAAANPPPAPNPAPQQKGEAPLPFGKHSLVKFASFMPPQSFPARRSFTLTGAAGGNIGGITNQCRKFTVPPAFSVRQSNDVAITLDKASADVGGNMLGRASMFGSKSGAFDGTIIGDDVKFTITWQDGTQSKFFGSIDENGNLKGLTRNQTTGQTLRFNGLQPWPCAEDDLCAKYASDAVAAATEFQSLKCGTVVAAGPGFWSLDQREHTKWCMAQSRGADSPIAGQTDGRKAQLDACQTLDAECTKVGIEVAGKNDEMKAIGCKDAIPSLQPDAAKAFCRAKPIEKDALVPAVQGRLDACKTRLAANNGVDPGPGGAGGDAGAGQGGAEPAPEQCVVVQLEEEAPKPNGANVLMQLTAPNAGADGVGVCAINSPCRFALTEESNGAVDFPEKPRFVASVHGGVAESLTKGLEVNSWGCGPAGGKLECTHVGNNLPIGSQVPGEVVVVAGQTWKKNDTLSLCVQAVFNDAKNDTNPDDNRVCRAVKLDPFNLKVKKTGDQSCAPGGLCRFEIDLFNPGPIDHNAPVVLTDGMNGIDNAAIVSISGDKPWPCAEKPTQIPFKCATPGNHPLSIGQHERWTMTIRLPDSPGAASFTNCAILEGGGEDASRSGGGASDATQSASCHSVTVKQPPAPLAEGAVTISKAAVTDECGEGTPCAFIVTIGNDSAQPIKGPISFSDVLSAGGQPMTQTTLAIAPAAPWTCVASAAPGMQCSHPGPLPPNGSLSIAYALQPQAGSLAGVSELTNCANYDGTRSIRSCVKLRVKQPSPTPPLEVVTPPSDRCFGGMVLVSGRCRCPAGQRFNGRTCVSDGDGGWNGIDPNAGSPPDDVRPTDVVSPPPGRCFSGMVLVGGRCRCPAPLRFNRGSCVRDRDDDESKVISPPQCAEGWELRRGVCRPRRHVDTSPPRCAEGWELRRGVCRPPRGGPDPSHGGTSGVKPGDDTKRNCPRSAPFGEPPNCCERPLRRGVCLPRRIDPGGGASGVKPGDDTKRNCPRSAPFGEPPNCCERPLRRGVCLKGPGKIEPGKTGPTPTIEVKTCPNGKRVFGKYARCPDTPTVRNCPPGYRVLNRPNKYGSYCESVLKPTQTKPPPSKTTPPPRPPPQKRSCSGGKVPRVGDGACVCPSGTRERGGQCLDSVR